jgi:hypothetical protein
VPDILFDVIDEGTTVEVIVENPIVSVGVNEQIVSIITVEGPAGPTGLPGEGVPVFGEQLSGVQDGVNLVLTSSQPYRPGSTAVYRNGLRETRGPHYTESAPSSLLFSTAPLSTDIITIDYILQ